MFCNVYVLLQFVVVFDMSMIVLKGVVVLRFESVFCFNLNSLCMFVWIATRPVHLPIQFYLSGEDNRLTHTPVRIWFLCCALSSTTHHTRKLAIMWYFVLANLEGLQTLYRKEYFIAILCLLILMTILLMASSICLLVRHRTRSGLEKRRNQLYMERTRVVYPSSGVNQDGYY